MMQNEHQEKTGNVPWDLCVVGVIGLLWNAMGALDYVMTETRNEAWMA